MISESIAVKDNDYKEYLYMAAEEMISQLFSIEKSGKFDDVIFDLSGGYDSRAALSPFLKSRSLMLKVRTNNVLGSDDLLISNIISEKFNLEYDQSTLQNYPIRFDESLSSFRSFFMGELGTLALPRSSSLGKSKRLRIGGGAGEIYRDFWGGILSVKKDAVPEVFLMSLIDSDSSVSLIKDEGLYSSLKEAVIDISNKYNDENSYDWLNKHYIDYRNRMHFGMRNFSTYHDALYFFPLLSTHLYSACKLLNSNDKYSGSLLKSFMSTVAPAELIEIPFDGQANVDMFVDKKIKTKQEEWQVSDLSKNNHLVKTGFDKLVSSDWSNWVELLDFELANAFARVSLKLPEHKSFIKSIFSMYERRKKNNFKSSHRLVSRVLGIDDFLYPGYSSKEVVNVSNEIYEYYNPIREVSIRVEGSKVYCCLVLKDKLEFCEIYEYAFYLYSNGERVNTQWYSSSKDFLFEELKDVKKIRVVGFARYKNNIFFNEGEWSVD